MEHNIKQAICFPNKSWRDYEKKFRIKNINMFSRNKYMIWGPFSQYHNNTFTREVKRNCIIPWKQKHLYKRKNKIFNLHRRTKCTNHENQLAAYQLPADKVEEWKSISGTYITSKALLTAVEAKLSPIEIAIPQNKQDTETHIFLNPKHSNITSTS